MLTRKTRISLSCFRVLVYLAREPEIATEPQARVAVYVAPRPAPAPCLDDAHAGDIPLAAGFRSCE